MISRLAPRHPLWGSFRAIASQLKVASEPERTHWQWPIPIRIERQLATDVRVTFFELKVLTMETTKMSPTGTPGANGPLAQGIEHAGSGAHQAIDKVSEAARPAVDRIAASAHQAVDKVKDAASQAAESLGVKADHLKQAQTHLTEACGSYMRTNPMASLGIAVGIGFVLSRLLSAK